MAYEDVNIIGGPAKKLIFKQGSSERTIVNASGKVELDVVGDVTGDVTGDLTGLIFGDVNTYASSGAIAVTDTAAHLNGNAGALAMTLADGTEGQRIILKCVDGTNNCVVTPAHLGDGSTLTFDAANEKAELYFDGTNWQILTNTSTLA